MSELSICDQFKWNLKYLRNLNIKDYMYVVTYMKKLEAENKRAMRNIK